MGAPAGHGRGERYTGRHGPHGGRLATPTAGGDMSRDGSPLAHRAAITDARAQRGTKIMTCVGARALRTSKPGIRLRTVTQHHSEGI
jgi:hypothetical protein